MNFDRAAEGTEDEVKVSCNVEFQCTFDTFHTYYMNIIEEFDAKIGGEDIFK